MNLTQFKKDLPGIKQLKCINHIRKEELNSIRTISKIKTSGFATIKEGLNRDIWIDYPKAKNFKYNGSQVEFYNENNGLMFSFEVIR